MNKIRILLFIGIISIFSLSACAGEGKATPETTLKPEDWPTPRSSATAPTPTAFPKKAAIIRTAAEAQAAEAAPTPTPAPPTPAPPTNTPAPPTPPPTPTPALTGALNTYGLNIRSGPGANYDIVIEARRNDGELTILAVDPATGWLNVRTPNGYTGWANSKFIDLNGNLSAIQGSTPQKASPSPTPAASGGNSKEAKGQTGAAQPPASSAIQQFANLSAETILIQLKSGGDIMLINRNGNNLRKLTTGIDPALSPDGSKIAFTRWDGAEQGSVWTINRDGSEEKAIIGGSKQVKSPGWSPDSKRIAVNFQEGGTLEPTSECWNTRNGGDPPINYFLAYDIETVVKGFDQYGPIVYICWKMPPDPHWKLRVIDVNSGNFEDKPAGQYAFAPAWDPVNDWRVVSVAGNGLVWTDVNRGVAEQLTDDPADRGPVFSPNGKYIAVTYWQHDHWEIHRLNSDGSGRVRLTKTPFSAIVTGQAKQANNASPAFSPDGSQIAFLTDRTGRWEVWVMNLDGSNQRPMFSNAVNDRLDIEYHGNDERSLGWGKQ